MDIRRIDRTGWLSPLIVRLTLYDDSRLTLIYPGDLESCKSLLRTLRRMAHDALIDGIPYRQYWGEVQAPSSAKTVSPLLLATACCSPRTRLKLSVSTSC